MAKKKTSLRGKTRAPQPQNSLVKALSIGIESAKYCGYEPEWYGVEITEENRKLNQIKAFNWYNYNFGTKEAKAFIMDYLKINDRKEDLKGFKKAKDYAVTNAYGWLARLSFMGWTLSKEEEEGLNTAIAKAIEVASGHVEEPTDDSEEKKSSKPNIQERMREKAAEAAGDIHGMLDDYIADGAKARHKFAPIEVLKAANILPAHVSDEIKHWEPILAEFREAYKGGDKDLKEAYSHLTKIQLRNIVKFLELIISDYHSYVALKKASRTPRKRKPKTPEQLARKLKYLKEFKELSLTSVKPEKIVGAKEMWAYDTKKRKLMYFVADEYAGALTVRNNIIEGYDAVKTTQKTIRKPAEQIKALMAASIPNTRKLYKNTKAVETKVSGRFTENIVILKVK